MGGGDHPLRIKARAYFNKCMPQAPCLSFPHASGGNPEKTRVPACAGMMAGNGSPVCGPRYSVIDRRRQNKHINAVGLMPPGDA